MKAIFYLSISVFAAFTACSPKQPKTFRIVEDRSIVEWKGSAPTHSHKGTFKVTGSFETNSAGNIMGGHFVIPITSITNTDLPAPAKDELLNHLKSPDFFNLAQFPEASFQISKVVPKGDSSFITGDFSMIGQTHPISFTATVKQQKDKMEADATFTIDRLKWGMTSFSDPKAELFILPEVELKLHIESESK